MGPRPYSDKSSLSNDNAISDTLSNTPSQVSPETSTLPSSHSEATASTPIFQEVIPTELHVDTVEIQDEKNDLGGPCFPTPADIMPYDHSLPDFIRQITNHSNLANLQSLSLRVISACISLHRMAAYLPNLKELNLEGSILNSLRDIGCNFKNLRILKVGRCQLESLDGTFGLSGLRELYAQKNLINDVTPCSNLPHIKHIDLSGNRIRNISYAGFLSVCSKLKSIIFIGNPATEVTGYRKYVKKILPQIEALDGIPFSNQDDEDQNDDKPFTVTEAMGNESDISEDYPDFYSVSPSDSMNNFFESEEDLFVLDKKNKQARNVANQDLCGEGNFESFGVFSDVGSTLDLQEELKILNGPKILSGAFEQTKILKITDSPKKSMKQRCASIQKLDKDIENRTKKSNSLSGANHFEDLYLPNIVSEPGSSGFRHENITSTTALEIKNFRKDCTQCDDVEYFGENSLESSKKRGKTSDFVMNNMKCNEIKKKPVTTLSPMQSDISEDDNFVSSVSCLTSGLPIRGNLTAALRNRNRVHGSRDLNSKALLTGRSIDNGSGDNI